MLSSDLLLFTVSVLPVFLVGRYIYNKDKQKESAKLLIKLFLGGIASCFLVLIITAIMNLTIPLMNADATKLDLFELLIYVFIGVALVEEFCKWIISYLIAYNDSDFDELYDAIIYCVFVALGFTFFENLLYVYTGGIGTGILRAFLAVPGHACDGMLMGYYLGLSKMSSLHNKNDLKITYLILSLLVPTITHGIYDYCLYTGKLLFLIIFIVFVISFYIYAIKKIKKVSSLNRKMKYNDNYCPNCGRVVESNYCPVCGRKNE